MGVGVRGVAADRRTGGRTRALRWAWALAGVLTALLAAASLGSVRSSETQGRAPGNSGHASLASLPVQAQGVISGAIGASQTEFGARPLAGGWRLTGGGLSAQLGASGAMVRDSATGAALSLSIAAVGRRY
ncbi:MAG: hypothetical protein ACYC0H_17635, partial [Solirubrobacteraceae bacterium]